MKQREAGLRAYSAQWEINEKIMRTSAAFSLMEPDPHMITMSAAPDSFCSNSPPGDGPERKGKLITRLWFFTSAVILWDIRGSVFGSESQPQSGAHRERAREGGREGGVIVAFMRPRTEWQWVKMSQWIVWNLAGFFSESNKNSPGSSLLSQVIIHSFHLSTRSLCEQRPGWQEEEIKVHGPMSIKTRCMSCLLGP